MCCITVTYVITFDMKYFLLKYAKWKRMEERTGLAHATGVHERNTVPYARFALKKRHGFCAKAREKNMARHRLGTL